MPKGFTPLEKITDLSRWSSPYKADYGLRPRSALSVRKQSSLTGFTLIELLIYLAIFCLISLVAADFLWQVIKNNQQNFALLELQDNGNFTLKKISRSIKQSQAVNQPLPNGATSTVLSLAMPEVDANPTVFAIQNNQLTMISGSHGPYALTSDSIKVNGLIFTNLSYDNTAGLIKVDLTLESVQSGQKKPLTISFSTSVSLR